VHGHHLEVVPGGAVQVDGDRLEAEPVGQQRGNGRQGLRALLRPCEPSHAQQEVKLAGCGLAFHHREVDTGAAC
jgi:hypothetical protein